MLIQLWKEANERPEAFMDHAGVLRDARTGKAISAEDEGDGDNEGANGGARDEEMREFWVYSVMKRSVKETRWRREHPAQGNGSQVISATARRDSRRSFIGRVYSVTQTQETKLTPQSADLGSSMWALKMSCRKLDGGDLL
jgi:hypothetical protein